MLGPETEAQAFRIVQESLTNVRKHADARRATLTLGVDGDTLVIRVADDGQGFVTPPPAPDGWPRYGLEAMRERAASIGGSIEWSTGPGAGTVIRLAVPVAANPRAVEGAADLAAGAMVTAEGATA